MIILCTAVFLKMLGIKPGTDIGAAWLLAVMCDTAIILTTIVAFAPA